MNTTSRILSALSAVGVALAMTPAASEARTIHASSAIVTNNHACFSMGAGVLTNSYCGNTQEAEVPLLIDSAGSYSVRVAIYGPTSASPVGCFAVATDRFGYWVSSTGAPAFPTYYGTGQDVSLGTISVPYQGAAFTHCDMAYSSRWASVSW